MVYSKQYFNFKKIVLKYPLLIEISVIWFCLVSRLCCWEEHDAGNLKGQKCLVIFSIFMASIFSKKWFEENDAAFLNKERALKSSCCSSGVYCRHFSSASYPGPAASQPVCPPKPVLPDQRRLPGHRHRRQVHWCRCCHSGCGRLRGWNRNRVRQPHHRLRQVTLSLWMILSIATLNVDRIMQALLVLSGRKPCALNIIV